MLNTRKEPRECARHGAYLANLTNYRGRNIETGCPECADDEARDESERYRREMQMQTRSDRLKKRFDRAGLPPRFSDRLFSDYIAASAAQARVLGIMNHYAEAFPTVLEKGTSLVLCGRVGTGKTHLACAVANHILPQGYTVLFLTAIGAVRRVKDCYRRDAGRSSADVIRDFTEPDLLILDEVGMQLSTDNERLAMVEILNERYEEAKPSIVISNLAPDKLGEYLSPMVMDRLAEGGGLVVTFNWDSHRSRGI